MQNMDSLCPNSLQVYERLVNYTGKQAAQCLKLCKQNYEEETQMAFLTFGININDVISVMQTLSKELTILGVALVLALVATVAVGFVKALNKPMKKLIRGNAWLAFLLVAVLVVNLIITGPMYSIISLAMGDGSISEESIEQAYANNEIISGEGMVLLENNGVLPLAENSKINVFGWASTNPVYGGTGSGALNTQYETTDLLTGLTAAGFQVNEELVNFYRDYQAARPNVGMWAQDWTLPEPNVSLYTDTMMSNAKEFSDVAVVVISRSGGENADLPTNMLEVVDGTWKTYDSDTGNSYFLGTYNDEMNEGNDWDAGDHYLQLSNREEELLAMVTENFEKVVVIVNAANAMELGFLGEYDVDGAIYAAGPGQNGFLALGQILDGQVNPSGRTVDTFVYDLTKTPTWNNFGKFTYDNMDEHKYTSVNWMSGQEATAVPQFVNYVDGIYVGYKFYETAAAEGLIDYDTTVAYPFGYGLSYTTFTQEMGEITENDGVLSVDVTVTNTGSVAGKEVVELYYNPPYINGGIEKASANLVAFDKTETLAPGASETVTLTFRVEDMASYDEYVNQAYVLDAGDYVISINHNAHDIIDSKTYTVGSTVVYTEGRSSDHQAPTNIFEDTFGSGITYLSRKDGFANYDIATAAPVNFSMSQEGKDAFLNNANYNPADYNDPDDVMPTQDAPGNMQLAELRGLSYDDPKWEELLNQMSIAEMNEIIAMGGYQTASVDSIGKVMTNDCDGPASINNNFSGQGSIGYCCTTLLASTWNTDCAATFGDSIGKMADELNVSGWYAPAMNTHRSAFAGRNFEYYSEDGTLAGKLTAQAIQAAEKHGVYSYMKHYALNDQETNRNTMLCTWSTEQAIREIYLKPFELAVKEGGADAVMSAFNYIGTTWAGGNNALLNTILRGEWGFVGMVLTDYFGGYGYMNADQAIRNGNDFMLCPFPMGLNYVSDTESATSVLAMRTAAKNVMYTVVNSRAYAEENLNPSMPGWQMALYAASAAVVALAVVLEIAMIKKYKKSEKATK